MNAILLAMSIKLMCPFPQIIIEKGDVTKLTEQIQGARRFCRSHFKASICPRRITFREDGKIEVDCSREQFVEVR